MLLFLKGIVIGIGKIIPGVSGSVLALNLNEYKNIINSLNNIFNKDNIKYLSKISLGILLSIIIGSKLMLYFLNKNMILTMLFFIGLIIGGIPKIFHNTKKQYYIYTLVGFFGFLFINEINMNITLNNTGIIIGIVESISTIIPGISGTAILSNLGLYNDYLAKWAELYMFDCFVQNIGFFISFLASLLITSIIVIKFTNYMIKNHEDIFNSLTLGFILSSLILLILKIQPIIYNPISILKFIIIIFLGFFIGYKFDNYK